MNPVGLSSSNAVSLSAPIQGAPPRDNSVVASEVADLFRQGRQSEAVRLLDSAKQGQPQAVQDALDRMVSARVGKTINPTPPQGLSPSDLSGFYAAVNRINTAGSTAPAMPNVTNLTEAQKFDVYASIVESRGSEKASCELGDGNRVILGLRAENPNGTLENAGRGAYNDRLVVLHRDAQGNKHVQEFNRANTESTAQYDANQRAAKPDPKTGIVYVQGTTTPARDAHGVELTGDHKPESGRLREGTTELVRTTHGNPSSARTNFALRPSNDAINADAVNKNRIERDTNHDGKFDQNDSTRFTALDGSFKIHSGSRTNTDSAGCTTIHPDDYKRFADSLPASQSKVQYVLTTTR